ncbi:glycosyltransferase [Patescibacteria group bacterium]
MKPKNILLISYHTCPLASEEGKESGGMNVYVYELSCQLAKIGYKIDVVTRCQDSGEPVIVKVCPNFRVIHLNAGPAKPIHKKKLLAYIPEFVNSVIEFIKKENTNYHILDAHYYQSGLIALKLNSLFPKKKPIAMTFHTLGMMKNLAARSTNEQEDPERIKIELKLVKKSDLIITPSANEKKYLKYFYNVNANKVAVIPPGVNIKIFKPINTKKARKKTGLNTKDNIILFVGRVEPLKGIDVIMYALKILKLRMPSQNIKLLVIGGDITQHIKKWSTPLKQLNKLRLALDVSENVQFVGQQPQHDLAYYYNAADVVVMPSHYESFGMAAAEAMACGVPVITTNVAGVSDLIDDKHKNLITSINNPLLLASQLEKLLTDTNSYKQARDNTLANVKDLSWEKIANLVSDNYSELTR